MIVLACCLFPFYATAQLSTNKDKFLGNITTGWPGSMDWDGFVFSDYWNQATPENASKWECVEGTRGRYNWAPVNTVYNYMKQRNMPFKFHCLVWGSQYPSWLKSLSTADRYKAIETWMDAVKSQYPDLALIDVVNEAVEGHQGDTYLMREALGGNGATGYDWIIKAFEMAAERWPDAILIYNDFNTFQWNTDQFIDLVRTLRDAGAPIDAYGCQSHDLGGMNQNNFRTVMTKIQNALKMPMYITEYDIGDNSDANQKWNYQQHFPVMWEADYCAGVTLWGWFYGQTWTGKEEDGTKGNSGLIKNRQERSALKWLREYMQTEKAKTAKSPFPGMVKEASIYIKPSAIRVSKNAPMTIDVNVRLKTKTIDHVDLYIGNQLVQTWQEAPYTFSYTPVAVGRQELKAVVTATDGTAYERYAGINVLDGFIPQPGVVAAVGKRYTSLTEVGTQSFAIVNEQEDKAFYGIVDQHLGYADYAEAFTTNASGFYFRLESLKNSSDASIRNYYMLRLITPLGEAYNIWGKPGYLNSQSAAQDCCFILGNTGQDGKQSGMYGEDIKYGAVWDIQFVEGKGYTLRNVGTGLYLHDNAPAKYSEPAYFTFCSLVASTAGISETKIARHVDQGKIYDLHGRRVDANNLRPGIYIQGGRKFVVK